ncbi:PSD1 and planctomycete cytochrome C domain-containing protein [Planctomicrobium sp. SH664]|uniref:PSD1 and planctomycete cytochrome C domain-containing protein n=1 Tax=Planctomicrobium sp. SH664 TaxID=3448125 RepID=UPI003F5B304F
MAGQFTYLSLVVWFALLTPVYASEQQLEYSRDIRPLLSRYCFSCHGPDESSREAGLRLDHREGALLQLESGERAIVPGEPDQSELLHRITTTDTSVRMPPVETGKSLQPEEVDLLRRWIEQGAGYEDHWAFRPVQDPVPPEVSDPSWPRNGIDHFVLNRLQQQQLSPSPEADRATLLRRLSFDLVGLPPSVQEVRAFLADDRPDAYERQVDRLLSSPHFGERWGRHWLDLARYADSNGYLGDELRPAAYRYRDWVIEAVNNDLPYDQFTILQLAGDQLPNATPAQKIATGFYRNSMKNTEAGADREADRVVQTVDRLSSIGTAWLGLTIGCAECHSHKFDPISHREFYEMYAFFNNLEEDEIVLSVSPPREEPKADRDARERKLADILRQLENNKTAVGSGSDLAFRKALETLAEPKESRSESDIEALDNWRADLDAEGRQLAKRYEQLVQQRPQPKKTVASAIHEREQLRPTAIHHRGDFRQPGEVVEPGTPEILPPLQPRGERADRLDFARWLVREDHPLTPRVAVNHIWKHLFGKGLVDTEENFGTAGAEPSHPELLDWLASRFVESGGSRKEMIRLVVNSATYRQRSQLTDELREVDVHNRWLARQSRYRLDAEIIRDNALAVSGLLNPKIGGPSIRPPLNSRVTTISRNPDWNVSPGAEKYRRGVYILFRRATPYPMLLTFDSPDSSTSCADRSRSNSPLQALTLLNDPVFFECAQYWGRHLADKENGAAEQWIPEAVERALGRPADSDETARLLQLYRDLQVELEQLPREDLLLIVGEESESTGLREQAARVLLARSLMNLDEFITRE